MLCYNCCDQTPNDESIFCYNCNKRYMKSRSHIIIGLLFLIFGGFTTILSFLNPKITSEGSISYIFYGAIIFGLFDFLRGLSDLRHFSKIVKNPSKYIKRDVNDGELNEDALQRYLSHKRNNNHSNVDGT